MEMHPHHFASLLTVSECERSDKTRKRFSTKFLAHLIPPPETRLSYR